MPGGVADKGARHRQIQASHPALAISIHSTGHWDREDPITGLANRLRQARVLPSEQQHVSLQELKGAEAVSTVPAAANQAVRARDLYQKIGEVWMDRELNMGPVIQARPFQGAVIDGEPERFNQGQWQLEGGTGPGDVAGVGRDSRLK